MAQSYVRHGRGLEFGRAIPILHRLRAPFIPGSEASFFPQPTPCNPWASFCCLFFRSRLFSLHCPRAERIILRESPLRNNAWPASCIRPRYVIPRGRVPRAIYPALPVRRPPVATLPGALHRLNIEARSPSGNDRIARDRDATVHAILPTIENRFCFLHRQPYFALSLKLPFR